MTNESHDRQEAHQAEERLEWVKPELSKISAGDAEGSNLVTFDGLGAS